MTRHNGDAYDGQVRQQNRGKYRCSMPATAEMDAQLELPDGATRRLSLPKVRDQYMVAGGQGIRRALDHAIGRCEAGEHFDIGA